MGPNQMGPNQIKSNTGVLFERVSTGPPGTHSLTHSLIESILRIITFELGLINCIQACLKQELTRKSIKRNTL